MKKKGQMNGLTVAAIGLVLFIIVVSIGASIMGEFGDAAKVSTAVTDDTINLSNGSAVALSQQEILGISANYNASDSSEILPVANYTLDAAAGTITLLDNTHHFKDWNFTYTYNEDSATTNITTVGTGGMEDLADWTATIVVILVAGLIIGMILIFNNQRR